MCECPSGLHSVRYFKASRSLKNFRGLCAARKGVFIVNTALNRYHNPGRKQRRPLSCIRTRTRPAAPGLRPLAEQRRSRSMRWNRGTLRLPSTLSRRSEMLHSRTCMTMINVAAAQYYPRYSYTRSVASVQQTLLCLAPRPLPRVSLLPALGFTERLKVW